MLILLSTNLANLKYRVTSFTADRYYNANEKFSYNLSTWIDANFISTPKLFLQIVNDSDAMDWCYIKATQRLKYVDVFFGSQITNGRKPTINVLAIGT